MSLIDSTDVRVAVIGTGIIAQNAHLPALAEEARASVQWIVDPREDALREVGDRWGVANRATDWRELLDRDDIDAVDVCTPAAFHADITTAFLERGTHVLVEKPVALTLDEVQRMAAAREQSGAVLMVAENWPYSSAYRRATEFIADDGGWTPILLQARHESPFRIGPPDATARVPGDRHTIGYLFAAGIHTLNLARHLVGEMRTVGGFAGPCEIGDFGPHDDDSVLIADFQRGAIGSFSLTGRSRHVGDRRLFFRLIAEQGVVEFDVWTGRVSMTRDAVCTVVEPAAPSRGYREEIAHFVDCVVDGETPLTSIDDQRRTLATVLAAHRSIEERRLVEPGELLREAGVA